jgi:hypothetical protein
MCLGSYSLKASDRSNTFHNSVIMQRTYKFYEIHNLSQVSDIETELKFETVTDKFERNLLTNFVPNNNYLIKKIKIITLKFLLISKCKRLVSKRERSISPYEISGIKALLYIKQLPGSQVLIWSPHVSYIKLNLLLPFPFDHYPVKKEKENYY